MYGLVLQSWITIRGTNNTPFIQDEADWADMSTFQDVVFWLDVREVTNPGGGISVNYETAPIKDPGLGGAVGLFQPMGTVNVAAPVTPALTKIVLANAPSIPLATWVRWNINSNAAGAWDLTFRILMTANRVTTATMAMPRQYGNATPVG